MKTTVQEKHLVKLDNIKYGQVFKPQCFTGWTDGDYFVKIKSNDGITFRSKPEYVSLKSFNTVHFDRDTTAYIMDAEIVIKDIVLQEGADEKCQ